MRRPQRLRVWRPILALWLVALLPALAAGADAQHEIEQLIRMVAESDCTFIRNGKRYAADKAADHLRLKYRRGRKYANTAEQFIERLASKSSMSGKRYYLECDGEPRTETGAWLARALATLRTD